MLRELSKGRIKVLCRHQAQQFPASVQRLPSSGRSFRISTKHFPCSSPFSNPALQKFGASIPSGFISRSTSSESSNLSTAGPSAATSMAAAGTPTASTPSFTVPPCLESLPYYSQFPLDRAAHLRSSSEQLWQRADTRLLLVQRDKVLVSSGASSSDGSGGGLNSRDSSSSGRSSGTHAPGSSGGSGSGGSSSAAGLRAVVLQPASACESVLAEGSAHLFLGLDPTSGAPYFAAEVSASAADTVAASYGAQWVPARTAGPDLPVPEASLLAVASSLLLWHGGAQFSARSGEPTASTRGGYVRSTMTSSGKRGSNEYPRIDNAVIMLVTCGNYCLLGRKPEWPVDRYSTLAGFVEVGEPLEVTVQREVAEESGVLVDLHSVRYVASQPWPFPRSLMIGFTCSALTTNQSHLVPASKLATGTASAAPPAEPAKSSGNGTGSAVAASAPVTDGTTAAATAGATAGAARGYDLISSNEGRQAAVSVGVRPQEVEQVMLAALALQPPTAQDGELADVRWFHRKWLQAVLHTNAQSDAAAANGAASLRVAGAGDFNVPGPYSLAHRLINGWLLAPSQVRMAGAGLRDSSDADGSIKSSSSSDRQPHPAGSDGEAGGWAGDAFPSVSIDVGTYKYVLLRLTDPLVASRSKFCVWGDVRAGYHMDVLRAAAGRARALGLEVEQLGGGRIEHDPRAKKVHVYGYSVAFGPAPHELSVALIRDAYPLYDDVMLSYEGY